MSHRAGLVFALFIGSTSGTLQANVITVIKMAGATMIHFNGSIDAGSSLAGRLTSVLTRVSLARWRAWFDECSAERQQPDAIGVAYFP